VSITRQTSNAHFGACHNWRHYSVDRGFPSKKKCSCVFVCHYHVYRAQQLFSFLSNITLLCTTSYLGSRPRFYLSHRALRKTRIEQLGIVFTSLNCCIKVQCNCPPNSDKLHIFLEYTYVPAEQSTLLVISKHVYSVSLKFLKIAFKIVS